MKMLVKGYKMISNHKIMKKIILGIMIFIGLFSLEVMGQTDLFILAGTGVGNIFDCPRMAYVSFELRKPFCEFKDLTFSYNVVLEGDKDERYVGLGASVEKTLSNRIKIAATTGVGKFSNVNFDLGSEIEFRSGIDLFYRISGKTTLVLSFYHYSNAGFSKHNPGTESVTLRLAIPLTRKS